MTSESASFELQTLRQRMAHLEAAFHDLEHSCREAQHRLSFLIQQNPLAVVECNTAFEVVGWNPTAEAVFGYSQQEALGRPVADLIVPDSAKAEVNQVMLALLQQTGGNCHTNENCTKDGRIITCEWFNTPVTDASGRVVGVISMVRDITSRAQGEATLKQAKAELESRIAERTSELEQTIVHLQQEIDDHSQAEAELQQKEAQYRSIFESVSDGLFIFEDDRLVEVNPAGCRMYGYGHAEMLTLPITRLIHRKSHHHLREFRQTLEEGGQFSAQALNVRKDGTAFDVEVVVNRCVYNGKPHLLGVVRDISDRKREEAERKQAVAELQQTQKFLESVLNTLPIMVVAKSAQDLSFVLWNPAAEALTGFAAADLLGKNDYDIFPPEQADFFTTKDREALNSGQMIEIAEEAVQTVSGENRIFHTRKTSILDAEGNPQYLLVITEDITERKLLEEQLVLQKARFDAFFLAANAGLVILDQQLRYVHINAALAEMNGLSVADHLGQTVGEVVPQLAETLEPMFQNILQTGEPVLDYELVGETPKRPGITRYWLASYYPLWGENNNVFGIGGVVIEITDRKHAEAALREQVKLSIFRADVDSTLTRSNSLEDILHQAAAAIVTHLDAAFARIWTLNPQENVLELQASAGLYTHLDGAHSRVPVGMFKIGLIAEERRPHMTNSVLDDPRVGDKAWAQREGMVAFAGYPLIVEDQLLGVMAMFARQPLSAATLNALSFVANELALGIKRKQAELALQQSEACLRQQTLDLEQALRELQHTQSQLVQSEKMSSLGQLVAGVAHEINNPVNFIYGNLSHANEYTQDLLKLLQLYQEHYPQPAPAIRAEAEAIDLEFLVEDLPKLLTSMKVGADRIQKIVASLRTFSRMDEAEFKAVNLHEGIDSTLLILQNRLKAKHDRPEIKVLKHYSNLPLVECYAGQLNQVFMNILTNALDALEERDSHRSPQELQQTPSTIAIYSEMPNPQQVTIRIVDNGPGMAESVRQRLFDPFFTTKPIGKGTGMGLSISYQIVTERHGGSLQCHSAPGEGAEFVIQIPLRQPV